MARRNANGEGTIYRRKDGRWEGAVYVLTVSGQRNRLRVYGKTRTEAHAKLVEAQSADQSGIPAADRTWRLAEHLDYWLIAFVQPHKRAKTYEQYECVVRLYLKPGLGRYELPHLTVALVQTFLDALLTQGHSVRRVQTVRTVLSAALTRAMRQELIARNVARLVELPPYKPDKVKPWSALEAHRFLDAASDHRLFPAFVLLVLYGMRRGEVLGLRWQDIDLETGFIHVRQQLQRIGRELDIGPVKTEAGERDLVLIPVVAAALRRHLANRPSLELTSDLAFTSSAGTPIEPRNFVRLYWRLCRVAGVRIIKLHHLRHTANTLLAKAGVAPMVRKAILGHSSVTVTQNVYEHTDMEQQHDGFSRVARLLGTEHEGSQAEEPGYLVGDGNRCRHFSRQVRSLADFLTGIISGGPTGDRTQDTLLKSSNHDRFMQHVYEVKKEANARVMRWALGAAAVNLAVSQNTYHQRFSEDQRAA